MKPVLLAANQPTRFYRGGKAIAAFRSGASLAAGGGTTSDDAGGGTTSGDAARDDAGADFKPEDWVASTVNLFDSTAGPSVLPDGSVLRDAIATDPIGFLGAEHFSAFGAGPALLVKLLDAGERLPVHVHPNRAFAARHLDCVHGKTEAWIVIATSTPDAAVYLGFRESVSPEAIAVWVAQQDTDAMLGALNRVLVEPGDTVLVPAGTPHAIGGGILLIEVQEPTDFSIMLEWKGFDLPARSGEQLGLAQPVALACIDPSGWDDERLATSITRHALSGEQGRRALLPTAADPFFRAEQIVVDSTAELSAQFAVLVVVDGAARLVCTDGALDVRRGNTVLVPHGAGDVRISGDASMVRCQPPVIA